MAGDRSSADPTEDLRDRRPGQPERWNEEQRGRQDDGDLGSIGHERKVESTGAAKRAEPPGRPDDDGEIHGQDEGHDGRLGGRGPVQVQHARDHRRQHHAENEDQDGEARVGDVRGTDQGRRARVAGDRPSRIPGGRRAESRIKDRQQAQQGERRRPRREAGRPEGAQADTPG